VQDVGRETRCRYSKLIFAGRQRKQDIFCLRENLTSSSYGEGLETGRASALVPRQPGFICYGTLRFSRSCCCGDNLRFWYRAALSVLNRSSNSARSLGLRMQQGINRQEEQAEEGEFSTGRHGLTRFISPNEKKLKVFSSTFHALIGLRPS
jgi:hypothetical protein